MSESPTRLLREPQTKGEGRSLRAESEPKALDLREGWTTGLDTTRARSSRLHCLVAGFIRNRGKWLWTHFDDLFSEAWLGLDSGASAIERGTAVENVSGYLASSAWHQMSRYVKRLTRNDDRKANLLTTTQGFEGKSGVPFEPRRHESLELESKWYGRPAFCIALGCTTSLHGKRSDALTCGKPKCQKRAQKGQVKAWVHDD